MAKLQLDAKKHEDNNKLKLIQMTGNDDLARDKMVQEIAMKVVEAMGKYGQTLNTEAIKREQEAPRGFKERIDNELGLQSPSAQGA